MSREFYTLRDAFDLIGKHLFGNNWTGQEAEYSPEQVVRIPSKQLDHKKNKQHDTVRRNLLRFLNSGRVSTRLMLDPEHRTINSPTQLTIGESDWPNPDSKSYDPYAEYSDPHDPHHPGIPDFPMLRFNVASSFGQLNISDRQPVSDRVKRPRRRGDDSLWYLDGGISGTIEVHKGQLDQELGLDEEKSKDGSAKRISNAAQHQLTQDDRRKGGARSNKNPWLQEAINRITKMLNSDGKVSTSPNVWGWLCEHALPAEPYEFDPLIPGCDLLYVDGETLIFKDQEGHQISRKRRSLDRYVREAKAANCAK